MSIDGAGKITLDANQLSRVMSVEGGTEDRPVALAGLKFINGKNSGNGGGVYNSGVLRLSRIQINNCSGNNGGGLHNVGTLFGTGQIKIAENESRHQGGGIYNSGTMSLLGDNTNGISSITIQDNSSGLSNFSYSGGGGLNCHLGTVLLSNVVFSGNHADSNSIGSARSGGGAIALESGTVNILGEVLISDNQAQSGGGIKIDQTSTLNCSGRLIIRGNASGIDNTGTVTLCNTLIVDNQGGGIYNHSGVINLINVTIAGNSAESGTGIYISGGYGE